jgi:signal transduction histidine kinase
MDNEKQRSQDTKPPNMRESWFWHLRKKPHRPWKHIPAQSGYRAKRRTLFGRFLVFLFFLGLPLVGLGILFGSLISNVGSTPVRLQMVFAVICGLPLLLVVVIVTLGALAFRNLGTPLVRIMAAADAVAEGNLSTRVDEVGPGEFRRMARSFNRMTSELERADKQRRNLTADVAHELRTPLHILQGNLEGLQDGVYQPTPEHITAMLDETHKLSRLVDDLQTLSLAETGQLTLRLELIDIPELLADIATSFSGQVESVGIDLKVETDGRLVELMVTGDRERMDQVISNLLANALRHTPTGGCILLRAEPLPDGVRIYVSDTGDGIPAEDLPFIFDRFWRGDKSRQRRSGVGSGLGLAIVKQFVHAQGGQISVESQLGCGTTFTIDLPKNKERSRS